MHQRFVIAVLVDARKLQVSVQVQLEAFALAREHDALVLALRDLHHLGRIERRFGELHQAIARQQEPEQDRRNRAGAQACKRERAPVADAGREHPGGREPHQRVQQAARQRSRHQAEPRQKQERERQRADQRAGVIEGERLGDQLLELEVAPQDAHQERELQAAQDPDREHGGVQHQAEGADVAERDHQTGRRDAADQRRGELHVHEAQRELVFDVARQVRADPERRKIDADHGRELRDAVAEHVARDGRHHQLVDERGGGDDQHHRQEQRGFVRAPGGCAVGPAARSRGRRGCVSRRWRRR